MRRDRIEKLVGDALLVVQNELIEDMSFGRCWRRDVCTV